MDISDYLQFIRFEGEARPDIATLRAIHRQHLLSIPYENIDVQLQRPVDLDIHRIYDKIVEGGRGGWCYEMNGLLDWALREIGFQITRLIGGVMRSVQGDGVLGNHLVLSVQLEQPWIADVGFGDGAYEPVPLRSHCFEQRGFGYGLEEMGKYWRFHNHEFGGAASFDFIHAAADESLLAEQSAWLSTAEDSPFVKALICQQFTPIGYEVQLGRVAKTITPGGINEWLIQSAEHLAESLQERFALDVPELATLWDRVCTAHDRYFGATEGN